MKNHEVTDIMRDNMAAGKERPNPGDWWVPLMLLVNGAPCLLPLCFFVPLCASAPTVILANNFYACRQPPADLGNESHGGSMGFTMYTNYKTKKREIDYLSILCIYYRVIAGGFGKKNPQISQNSVNNWADVELSMCDLLNSISLPQFSTILF